MQKIENSGLFALSVIFENNAALSRHDSQILFFSFRIGALFKTIVQNLSPKETSFSLVEIS